MTPDVAARVEGRLGRITLNRPTVLHALSFDMCAVMTERLVAWQADPAIDAVLIDHAAGTRGFCAGGDIRMLQESGQGDGAAGRAFFHTEYRLNHLIHGYPKPVVVVMDGVTMGGGVGISMPATFRIATERTMFAMPETGIGLFPDVGGGWFLPRLPGSAGAWLALTGARLKPADCLTLGIATHYVGSQDIEAFTTRLAAATADPEAVLKSFAVNPEPLSPATPFEAIDRLFAFDTVEDIFAALEADGSDWASAQLKTLRTKSPLSMKVALRQLRTGAGLTNFADNMTMEYRLGARMIHTPDFQEGVRAVVIDKDNKPRWVPDNLEGVRTGDLDAMFAPLMNRDEWTPLQAAVRP